MRTLMPTLAARWRRLASLAAVGVAASLVAACGAAGGSGAVGSTAGAPTVGAAANVTACGAELGAAAPDYTRAVAGQTKGETLRACLVTIPANGSPSPSPGHPAQTDVRDAFEVPAETTGSNEWMSWAPVDGDPLPPQCAESLSATLYVNVDGVWHHARNVGCGQDNQPE